MLVDAHCHLDFSDFDDDFDRVIEAAREEGVCHFVVPGTTRKRWPQVKALGERSDMSHCLGLHPYFVDEHDPEDLARLDEQLHVPGVVGVGECGIDARFDQSLERQWHYFDSQLKLAKSHHLPVVIHCVKANDEVGKRLHQLALPRAGLIHAFSGSYEQASKFLDLGYVLGLGGAATYDRAQRLHRVIKQLPSDAFVLETDSPDMPLSGGQGRRNEPSQISRVCETVARLRNQPVEEVAASSTRNAARLFNLRF
ncbi:TatD family hydrolase [Vreelandella sp. EE22]